MTTQVDSRIAAVGATKEVFSSQNHTTGVYVRSSTCWMKDVDTTCASPWNSDGGAQKAGTLISPRHVLFAAHFPIATGSTLRFVQSDNTVVTRTLTAVTTAYGDTVVGLLNADVPSGISFAKVFPGSVNGMVPNRTPGIIFDQEEKALVNEFSFPFLGRSTPLSTPTRQQFYEDLVSGDSGNPTFFLVNGNVVLAAVGTGEPLHLHLSEINTAMASLGGGIYQVTTVDLSEFQ